MKRIAMILIIGLILSGCNNTNDYSREKQKTESKHNVSLVDSEIFDLFLGKWIVGELSFTPRVALMADEYAKENSDIVGEELSILSDNVFFRNQIFYVTEISICNEAQLMSLFNISLGDAAKICGGEVVKENLTTTGKPIKLVSLYTKDKQKHINIVISTENELMLWVGEAYKYIGFYNLKR